MNYTKKIKANLAVLKKPTGEKTADSPKMYPAVLPRLPKGEHWGGWEKYEKDHPEEKGLTLQEQMANATKRAFERKAENYRRGDKKIKGPREFIEDEKNLSIRYSKNPAIQAAFRKPEIQEE